MRSKSTFGRDLQCGTQSSRIGSLAGKTDPSEGMRYPWSKNLNPRAALTVELSTVNTALPVVALVGLAFEARIAAGQGVLVVCRGSECELSDSLQRALRDGCRSIISFRVAGRLRPD